MVELGCLINTRKILILTQTASIQDTKIKHSNITSITSVNHYIKPDPFIGIRRHYKTMHYAYMSKVVQILDPNGFEEAKAEKKWVNAMQEEIDALVENKTWDLVKLPKEKNVVGWKWVYKTKHDSNGNVNRHKVRLVAKGYAQMQGIDYDETFALVAKMATLRTLLAVSAAKIWFLHHMDVNNAFLHGNLEYECLNH